MKCIDDEIPFEIPQSWCWVRLGDICIYLHRGKSPQYGEHKILPIIAQKCNQWDMIYTDRCLFSSTDSIKKYKEEQFLQIGDVIINSTGGGTVGRTGYVDSYVFERFSKYVADSHVTVVRPMPLIVQKYIYYFLLSPQIQIGLEDRCSGSTNQIELGTSTIYNYLIPIPPVKEQRRIVEKIQEVLPVVDIYGKTQVTLDKLNTEIFDKLKKSVLQEAIQGKLVPQDPNDEPASVLLDRIKEEKAKLFKEGKLKKKDLVDSVIFKGDDNKYYETIDGNTTQIESQYEFPIGWEILRLHSICVLTDGVKQTGSQICLDAKYLRGKASATYLQQGKFVEQGDNIILVDGENSGEVFTVPIDGYMGSTFKQLWISKQLYLPYVLAFIRFYKEELRNSKKGAAIPHLNKDIFNNLLIGIPPYDEQVRIVGKLEAVISSMN